MPTRAIEVEDDDRKRKPAPPAVTSSIDGGSSWSGALAGTSHNSSATTTTSTMAPSSSPSHRRKQHHLSSSRAADLSQPHFPVVLFDDDDFFGQAERPLESPKPKKKKKKKKKSSKREEEDYSGGGEKKKKKKNKSSKQTLGGSSSLEEEAADSLPMQAAAPPSPNSSANHPLAQSFPSHNAPSTPFSIGASDEVPHDLLVNYMIAMGGQREEADRLAHVFAAEQLEQRQQQSPRPTSRYVRPANVTLSNKLQEAEQRGAPRRLPSVGMNSYDGRSIASFSITGQQSTAPSSNQQNHTGIVGVSSTTEIGNSLKLAEAIPVPSGTQWEDEMESNLPIVYADTTPIPFKNLVNERPVRRLICIVALAVIGAVIGIVVYFTAIKESLVPEPALGTNFPSMAPSMAPTFISDDILSSASALSGFDALANTSSPQYNAVGWMSSFDQRVIGSLASQGFAQRYALVVMYYSFMGQDWINQEQWLRPDLHECDWSTGISCEPDITGTGIVIGFDATRNNLRGTIPPEVGLLASIKSFQIPKNSVGGTIPDSIGKMTSLSAVDMHDNAITGPIPVTINGARDLIRLDLGLNGLNSSLPDSMYQLTLLRTLRLRSNKITGTLSVESENMKDLSILDMRHNQISGSLPVDLINSLPSLDIIQLDYNQLTGRLPVTTPNGVLSTQTLSLSHNQLEGIIDVALDSADSSFSFDDILVQVIDLSYNNLTGTINPLLGVLPTLRYLDLSGNSFSGQFMSFLSLPSIEHLAIASNLLTGVVPVGDWSKLTHFDVSGNQLSSGIPEHICSYPDLEFLILSDNPLGAASIPTCFGALSKLRHLEICNTELGGTIPTAIGLLQDLEIIDVSSNALSGSIPTQIGRLTAMEHLKLNRNELSGPIPSDIGDLLELKFLHLEDNALSGLLPTELGFLASLESLVLVGNNFLGEIPEGLCTIDTLELSVTAIGCAIGCECCTDSGSCL